jgi:hypothetical protein
MRESDVSLINLVYNMPPPEEKFNRIALKKAAADKHSEQSFQTIVSRSSGGSKAISLSKAEAAEQSLKKASTKNAIGLRLKQKLLVNIPMEKRLFDPGKNCNR